MLVVYELLEQLPSSFTPVLPPRLSKLYKFLLENRGLNKRQAVIAYWGNYSRKKYFNTLVNDLKKALIQHFIAHPSLAENAKRAMIEDSYREFATYKILLLGGKRKAAIELATQLHKRLKEIEYYPLLYAVVRDLLFHYSNGKPNQTLCKKYEVLLHKYDSILKAETMVHAHYNKVVAICNTKDGVSAKHLEYFQEAMQDTLPLLRLESHSLNRYIYNIAITRYLAACEYAVALGYCEEALSSVPEDHPNSRSLQFAFLHRKVSALSGLGEVIKAKEIARKAAEVVETGSSNWHICMIKRIIVCFHSGDYQEAYELYKAHEPHPPKRKNIIEYWNILEGYLFFLIERGYIKVYDDEKFSLGKFLNQVPIYSKDKIGQNINIIIIQILVNLLREQYGQIIDRVESLRAYKRSYTRNSQTKRANIFITMIVKMESAQFHRSGTEYKTAKLKEQMDLNPLTYGQNLAVELIPYEVLWEEILSMLEYKFRAITVKKKPKQRK